MDEELPKTFEGLAALGAPILHYKICSTFDSSPGVGSIGRAIDIGVKSMGGRWSPTIVGAPRLKRYQAFGNLFAASGATTYRLDRHPTMSRHPVTPMHESDLRLHLTEQTSRRIELIDLLMLREGHARSRLAELAAEDVPVVLIDVLDDRTLLEAGRLVWENRDSGIFSASSSGLSYALAAYWKSMGLLPDAEGLPIASEVDVIAGVSGSCSPNTAAQIQWARNHGFSVQRLQVRQALGSTTRESEINRCVQLAAEAIVAGTSALVFSAEGPDDETVTGFDELAETAGLSRGDAARAIGTALAEVMRRLLDTVPLSRVVVAGGDSSGEVASKLGIDALSVAASLVPGAPLCRAWSDQKGRDGLEIVLKGGQMGTASFFGAVRAGRLLVDD
jgi:uncharacterized protein YgbK (DUF1537 family)